MRPSASAGSRERLLGTAYELFSRHGIQSVGIDRIIADAGVAKATLYHQFPSKEDLAIAALQRRQRLWTSEWLAGEIERAGGSAGSRLLAIFDAFGQWFDRGDFEGCFFIGSLLESHNRKSPIGTASVEGLADLRALVASLAEEAGADDTGDFARDWQLLMSGSIISATQGDAEAAPRAREIASLVLDRAGIKPD